MIESPRIRSEDPKPRLGRNGYVPLSDERLVLDDVIL